MTLSNPKPKISLGLLYTTTHSHTGGTCKLRSLTEVSRLFLFETGLCKGQIEVGGGLKGMVTQLPNVVICWHVCHGYKDFVAYLSLVIHAPLHCETS